MKRLGFCSAVLLALASMMSAHSGAPVSRGIPSAPTPTPTRVAPVPDHTRAAPAPPGVFEDYCFECHGTDKPKADLSIERLLSRASPASVGANWQDWERVADMLESGRMPPKEATLFPTDAERHAALGWIRGSFDAYESEHAGEPGRVTVRRLTSAEYAYAVRDLTGIDLTVGVDASSDSVGGEGFANFGDVQFVQDDSIERYLEAAKVVADHAVVGAGPLDFYGDAGKTGLELSALHRIDELYAAYGFRVVSGEGGFPFGLDRYGKAFYVAWYYKHRAALGDPSATLRGLAAKEGITGRFAEHVWTVVNKPDTGYPLAGHGGRLGRPARSRGRWAGVDRPGAGRHRRPLQDADDVAQLVLRARRSGGRRSGGREPARVRRRVVEGGGFGDVPARKGHEPGSFGIFVDPVHCKGCAECVEVCAARAG